MNIETIVRKKAIQHVLNTPLLFRVKYLCYHYNTGMGNNGQYVATRDFTILADAQAYLAKVEAGKVEVEDGYVDGPASIVLVFTEFEIDFEPEK
jgi:hypothetical protein